MKLPAANNESMLRVEEENSKINQVRRGSEGGFAASYYINNAQAIVVAIPLSVCA
jgi:hypothetical protein